MARPSVRRSVPSSPAIAEVLACGRPGCSCASTARRGTGRTHCPVHADDTPSLSLSLAQDGGKVLVRCQAGCDQKAVIAALREKGLWPEAKKNPNGNGRRIVSTYGYHDAAGHLLYETVRYQPKDFRQCQPDGNGGYVYNLDGVCRVLYHLPQLVAAMPDETVYVVEGEKDADRLAGLGFVATTSPMGARKWRREYTDSLAGRTVRIIPDNDEPGRRHAQDVAASLHGVAAEVRILALPGLPEDGDISDWLDAGGTAEALCELGAAAPAWDPESTPPTVAEQPHLTDTGNAERFRRLHGDNARWCDPLGGWLLWNGQRWRPDTGGMVLELAKATALTIYTEVAGARNEDERKAIAKWAIGSESQARLDAMLYLARSLLPAEPSDFDADPWVLNVNNGTIDLHSGEIREFQRSDMITMLAPVVYDAEAHDDVFDRFLNDVTGGDSELATYLQRAVGYSLTGDTREEVLFLLLGPTATGKSTLLESVGEMLGDYALKLPIDTFLQRRDAGAARPDIARLRGARFVIALEAGKGRHLDEPAVKEIVGGDSVSARFLYHDLITFRPVCKLWLGSNFAPQMNNLDSAIWRRVRRIPFERSFGDKLDPKVKLHLRRDPKARSALLAWAVRGLLDWQRDGLGHAAIVDVRTSELRAEMNPIGEFVDARCVLGKVHVAGAKELRTAYETWAKDTGAKPIINKDWGEQLRDLGCESRRLTDSGGKKSAWFGIGILADGE